MYIKNANKYTDKNRPSGYYMVNGKRRYWSKENGKYYAEQIGSTGAARRLKDIIIGNPEETKKRLAQFKEEGTRRRSADNRRSTPGETDKQVARDNKRYGNTVPKGSFTITKKDETASNGDSTHDIGGSNQNGDTNPPAPKKKTRFKGTVDEGRRIWAEKYSGDKYKGQAIHKEAKAYLLKIRKRDRPNISGRPLRNNTTA